MSMKDIVLAQYREIINRAAKQSVGVTVPPEGWLCTVRKALQMSGAQLGRRLNVSRAQVSSTEKKELEGRVTIKTMQQMAEAMGCRFVYTIVPENTVEDIVEKRAREKALELVGLTNQHMALEDQTLSPEQRDFEVERLQREIMNKLPSDFWDDRK